MNDTLLWLIPTLPFAGFLVNGTLGRKFPRALVSTVALIATLIPALIVLKLWIYMNSAGAPDHFTLSGAPWIAICGFQVNFAFAIDHLTLVMLGIVTGVGFLIHVYSVGYMAEEEGFWRFFAYLNLFMFFMLVLVLAVELPVAVRRLGRRRPRLVPAHRLLLQARLRRQRRQKGLHRQPHRRLRLPARDVPAHRSLRQRWISRTSSAK